MIKNTSLDTLAPMQRATVTSLSGDGAIIQRFEDLGIIPGTEITCLMISPLGDPSAYLIRDALIAIRREDALKIGVCYGIDV